MLGALRIKCIVIIQLPDSCYCKKMNGKEEEIYNILYEKKEINDKNPKLRTEDEKKKLKNLSYRISKIPKNVIDNIIQKFPLLQRKRQTPEQIKENKRIIDKIAKHKRYTECTEFRAKKIQQLREKRSKETEIERQIRLNKDKEYHRRKRAAEREINKEMKVTKYNIKKRNAEREIGSVLNLPIDDEDIDNPAEEIINTHDSGPSSNIVVPQETKQNTNSNSHLVSSDSVSGNNIDIGMEPEHYIEFNTFLTNYENQNLLDNIMHIINTENEGNIENPPQDITSKPQAMDTTTNNQLFNEIECYMENFTPNDSVNNEPQHNEQGNIPQAMDTTTINQLFNEIASYMENFTPNDSVNNAPQHNQEESVYSQQSQNYHYTFTLGDMEEVITNLM